MSKSQIKMIATGLLITGLGLFIYNKVGAVRRVLGGA